MLTIIPIRPRRRERGGDSTQVPARRSTFGHKFPSRRTFGHGLPSRRTFGHNLPSRRAAS